jgi:serine/threonine protein kinase
MNPGTRLGPYEILGLLGAGGMGEVYRARDERIGREVAIKVLPAAYARDPDRLHRFGQEVRAAGALNHPNILTIHDTGSHDGRPYIVSELLEGRTLRERLTEGPIPLRKTVEYAHQAARGLAAAHHKGIVHRDLKPENLFLTGDGRVKILDFGLSRLLESEPPTGSTPETTVTSLTEPGIVLGTVGYMSPEQARARPADHRSDLFSLGAILYEMLTGRRAFRGDSAVETMNAILKEDPIESPDIPAALAPVLRHCLEKSPEERFQSARDLVFALEMFSGASGANAVAPALTPGRKRRTWWMAAAAIGVASIALGAFLLGSRVSRISQPSFQRLTFRRGTIWQARFTPDGQTIVYGAAWDGAPMEIFSTRAGSTESRSLGLSGADILSISPEGDMAFLISGTHHQGVVRGTLTQAPLAGGAPRPLLENVVAADWGPNKTLAVARVVAQRIRIEFPIGKVLCETGVGPIRLRVSPRGDRVAFTGPGLTLSVVDVGGRRTELSSGWDDIAGPVWSRSGDEIWFSATRRPHAPAVRAVDLRGKHRLIEQGVTALILQDVARDGRMLLTSVSWRAGLRYQGPGQQHERDLSRLDWSIGRALSADGTTAILNEDHQGGGPHGSVYLRRTDGSPAVRLGDGRGVSLSPDGKWVLAIRDSEPRQLTMLPTGAGEPRVLDTHGIQPGEAQWFADGRRILLMGSERGRGPRNYILELDGAAPRPATPEGFSGQWVSPDGKLIAYRGGSGPILLYPTDGGPARPVPGEVDAGRLVGWTADGRALHMTRGSNPVQVIRQDVSDGRRELVREIRFSDPAGIFAVFPVLVTPDGQSCLYGYMQHLSDLYIVEGLR